MNKMFIIDGNAILFRSFHAIKTMTNNSNKNISGIYGFANQILSILKIFNPKYLIVALDTGGKTWRHEHCDKYKSNRIETPKELIHQFAWMRLLCDACGIRYYEGEKCEADDWIASCVAKYKSTTEIVIVSADKDLYQLVDDNVFIMHPFSTAIIKREGVYAKFNVYPHQILDFLVLIGDNSDFIEGVKGIGPKTASSWINQYDNIDGIIKNIDLLKPLSRRNMMKISYHLLEKAKYLIALKSDLTIKPIDETRIGSFCVVKLKETLIDIGLYHLFDKFEKSLSVAEQGLIF